MWRSLEKISFYNEIRIEFFSKRGLDSLTISIFEKWFIQFLSDFSTVEDYLPPFTFMNFSFSYSNVITQFAIEIDFHDHNLSLSSRLPPFCTEHLRQLSIEIIDRWCNNSQQLTCNRDFSSISLEVGNGIISIT